MVLSASACRHRPYGQHDGRVPLWGGCGLGRSQFLPPIVPPPRLKRHFGVNEFGHGVAEGFGLSLALFHSVPSVLYILAVAIGQREIAVLRPVPFPLRFPLRDEVV